MNHNNWINAMAYIHTINIKKYLTPKSPRILLKTTEITTPLFQAHEAVSKIYPIIIVYTDYYFKCRIEMLLKIYIGIIL
jgi:hypothetical protein